MGVACTFALNDKPMSLLVCPGGGSFPAFSGQREGRDNPSAVHRPEIGPLPTGRYYIVDRQSGGRLGALRHFFLDRIYGTDRTKWFALYRDDGVVDDSTVIDGIRRGAFRLHPIGPRGLSEGCITLAVPAQFDLLRAALLRHRDVVVPGGSMAYGTVDVH